jgi:ribosome biogenesis protein YTM1
VETGINTDTYNGSKAVFAVAAPAGGDASSSSGPSVVAFGGSDNYLRLWDQRVPSGEAVAVKPYAGHRGWISAVAWRPGSSYHVATGSHDGVVRVWDLRSSVAVGTVEEHKDKVLCVGWWGEGELLSGGADCKLQLSSLPSGTVGQSG